MAQGFEEWEGEEEEVSEEDVHESVEEEWEEPGQVEAEWEEPGQVEAEWEEPGQVEEEWEEPGQVEEEWEEPDQVEEEWEEGQEESGEQEVTSETSNGQVDEWQHEAGEEEAPEADPETYVEPDAKTSEWPKTMALGGHGKYVVCWDEQVSWSGLDNKLDDVLTGKYKTSDQDSTAISAISFTGDRYAICYEGGTWQVCCDAISSDVMNAAGTIWCLSLGPKGSYTLLGSESHRWSGIPKRAQQRIRTRNNANIEWVALGTQGAYFMLFDDGAYYWAGVHPKLDILLRKKSQVHRVFLSTCDWSYFLQLKDGSAFWNVSDEFDSEMGLEPQQAPGKKRKASNHLHLSPSDIRFSHHTIGSVFSDEKYNIKDTFLSLYRCDLQPHDLPLMYVVQHKDSYVSISNRRLAVFRLLQMFRDSNLQVPVELVQKMGSFSARYTTQSDGEYAYLRGTNFYVGRTREDTNFDPFNHQLSHTWGAKHCKTATCAK